MAAAEASLWAGSQATETTEEMEAQLESAMANIAELEAVAKKTALRHTLELAKSTMARMEAQPALADTTDKVPEPAGRHVWGTCRFKNERANQYVLAFLASHTPECRFWSWKHQHN